VKIIYLNLTPNAQLKKRLENEARKQEESFSHTDQTVVETFTIFSKKKPITSMFTILAGENLGMAYELNLDETGMAELLSNGWVDSPGLENMIRKEIQRSWDGSFF